MNYLLAISLGPVQEFIAAARKTDDLYAGSNLLVELAKRVAKTVQENGGDLIFPADAAKDGPNKIVAELTSAEPQSVACKARKAAQQFLQEKWEEAAAQIAKAGPGTLETDLAEDQIGRFLEFYAAWVPLNGNYANARKQVERLLAGRKALREFEPPLSQPGRPKSPLDPSRDCVLQLDAGGLPIAAYQHPSLSLKKSETLDAVSLLKRVEGGRRKGQTPSTSLMAARAIEPNPPTEKLSELQALAKKCQLGEDYSDLLFPERVKSLCEEQPQVEAYLEDLASLRREYLKESWKSKEAPAYYAILVADGDRMGQLLDGLDKETHKRVSSALSEFSQEAQKQISKHRGYPVYTGGDDVVALLPVNRALACATTLKVKFAQRLGEWQEPDKAVGTLSVGVAIVHHLESLDTALYYAREAEKAAKKTRNSLAVALHTRGGAPITVSQAWAVEPLTSWRGWIQAFAAKEGLAAGTPYELLRLAREFGGIQFGDAETTTKRLRQEAARILRRKEGGKPFAECLEKRFAENGASSDEAKALFPTELKTAREWEEFAQQLVVARFLAGYPQVEETN